MNRNRLTKRIAAGTMAALVATTSVPVEGLASFIPAVVKAATTERKEVNGFVIEDGVLTKYKGSAQNIVIPDEVTEIDDYVFFENEDIKSVKMGANVKKIGEAAFEETSITSIELVAVEEMGRDAFHGCEKLKEITIRSGVKKIGNECFYGCKNVETVTIEPGVEWIGQDAFANLKKLKEIVIPSSVVYLDMGAFSLCESLEEVCLPTSLKYIGFGAFEFTPWMDKKIEEAEKANEQYIIENNILLAAQGTYELEQCEIPDGVTVIADVRMSAGKKLEIPDRVTGIASISSDTLEEITIADSVTHIGDSGFGYCETLKKITLPAYLQRISEYMFEECSALESIKLPEQLKSIGYEAFKGCTSLSSIVLPDGVEYMDDKVFRGCSKLKEITIPESVTYIGDDITTGCASGIVIKGYTGSTAEAYAKEHNITFKSIGTSDYEEEAVPAATAAPTAKPTANPQQTGEKFQVILDANGGFAEQKSIQVENGKTYGNLPSASREGYLFAGWFTAIEGGTKVENTTSVNLSTDQILYAHWLEFDCTITFDANGGIVGTKSQMVSYGDVYGTLPEPTKSGATFLGWYTDAEGGQLITEDMVVDFTGKLTLYAHWESSYKKITEDSLTYSFGNGNSDFNYAEDYEIPYSVFKYMYGDTMYAKNLFAEEGVWGGNCFGMSSTSIFFNVDSDDIDTEDFSASATLPSKLKITDKDATTKLTLARFIESMQISQYNTSVSDALNENWNELDSLCDTVEKVQNGKGSPVIVCVYGPEGGHAIVGYKVEGNKLYVSDPNFPKDSTRAIELEKSSSGKVNSWYYHLNDAYDWGSDYDDCGISFVPYDVFYQTWEKRSQKCYSAKNLLKTNVMNATIYDENNKKVAQIKDGNLITDDPDIVQIKGMEVDNSKKTQGCEISLPNKKYTIENTSTTKNFEVQVMGTDISADASTTASKVTVNVDDASNENQVFVEAKKGETYQVTLKSQAVNDKGNVVIKGTGSESATVGVSQSQGDVQFENCNSATVKVNGKTVTPVEITAKAGNGGSVSREGTTSIAGGEDITYAITPDYGYMVKDVVVDGVSQGNITSYTFPSVKKAHTIEAVFEKATIANATVSVTSATVKKGTIPDLQIKIGNQILTKNDDYMVTCKSETSSNMTLQIKGIGYYSGILTKTVSCTGGSSEDTSNSTVKKGQVVTVGNLKYKVTSTSAKTVSVAKKVKSTKSVTIPATIKISGKSYKVTAIGASVWKNDKTIQTITVGNNVQTIGANAWNGAKNLKKITIKGSSLKKVGSNALKGIYKKAVIKVPSSKKAAYKKILKGKGQKKTVVVK